MVKRGACFKINIKGSGWNLVQMDRADETSLVGLETASQWPSAVYANSGSQNPAGI